MDVFGLGQGCIDYLVGTTGYPESDAKHEVFDLEISGGGPVATALVALSRWGHRCAFTGVVGDDPFGAEVRASLEQEGVDVGGLLVRPGEASQLAWVVREQDSGHRTIFWRRPTGAPPAPDELDLAALRGARVLHTDGLYPEASLVAARAARQTGVLVSVDAGTLREGSLELARLSDLFVCSRRFSDAWVGPGGEEETCRRLEELGPRLVGVTRGAQGWVARCEGRRLEGAAHPARVVDTTGCGDLFHAGLVHGALKGWELPACLDFAAWAAARVAEAPGGRAGIPSATDWSGSGSLRP